MRLFWLSLVLSLVLSLAERLYPVVREDDGKKSVARRCFQPDFPRFAFFVYCNSFRCHRTIVPFLLSIFSRLNLRRSCGQPIFPSPQPPQSATPVEIRVSSVSLLWVEAFEAPQQTRKSLIPRWGWHRSKDISTSMLRVPPRKMLFWRRP